MRTPPSGDANGARPSVQTSNLLTAFVTAESVLSGAQHEFHDLFHGCRSGARCRPSTARADTATPQVKVARAASLTSPDPSIRGARRPAPRGAVLHGSCAARCCLRVTSTVALRVRLDKEGQARTERNPPDLDQQHRERPARKPPAPNRRDHGRAAFPGRGCDSLVPASRVRLASVRNRRAGLPAPPGPARRRAADQGRRPARREAGRHGCARAAGGCSGRAAARRWT